MANNSSGDSVNVCDTISLAQTDMCKAYASGSVGIIVSGITWLISAFITYHYSAKQAVRQNR